MVGIYKITNPKGQAYIGLSKNIEKRFDQHKKLQMKDNIQLKESLIKYGGGSHTFEVLEEINISSLDYRQSNSILRKRERYWIKHYETHSNGLNGNMGGSGCGSHTAESKAKIGKANSKPKPKDFGKNRSKDFYTQEWKDKISKANKGRVSPIKGKVGPNKGKIMNQEQKDKISKANKGKSKPKNFMLKRKKKVLHINSNTIYESITQASKLLNFPPSRISLCCNGKIKSTKGETFKFL